MGGHYLDILPSLIGVSKYLCSIGEAACSAQAYCCWQTVYRFTDLAALERFLLRPLRGRMTAVVTAVKTTLHQVHYSLAEFTEMSQYEEIHGEA